MLLGGSAVRIIFLDVDGVLNHDAYLEDVGIERRAQMLAGEGVPSGYEYYRALVDPDAVARLRGLVERTDAKIVVSSCWRGERESGPMRALLDELVAGAA